MNDPRHRCALPALTQAALGRALVSARQELRAPSR
jgi:hypothetical protein